MRTERDAFSTMRTCELNPKAEPYTQYTRRCFDGVLDVVDGCWMLKVER